MGTWLGDSSFLSNLKENLRNLLAGVISAFSGTPSLMQILVQNRPTFALLP